MKINIQQKDLLKHINIAQRAIGTYTTMQILEGIYLIAENNTLTLISTDLKISIESKVNAEILKEGEVIINSNLLGNIIRKMPNDIIHMEINDEKLYLTCQNSIFQINPIVGEAYPEILEKKRGESIFISAGLLKESILQTEFATSQEMTKPILTGVLMNLKRKELDFVALDGYRIALKTLKKEFKEAKQVIIPAKSLKELSRILPEEGNVEISFLHGNVLFEFESTKFYTRLLEGSFIQYESVISSAFSTKFTVGKKLLEDAIVRAALLSKEDRTNLIKLNLEEGKLTISSNTEIGYVREEVFGEQRGENLLIAFNAKYLLDGIQAMHDMEIVLQFSGPLRACVIQGIGEEFDFRYIVLPVKLAE